MGIEELRMTAEGEDLSSSHGGRGRSLDRLADGRGGQGRGTWVCPGVQ